MPEATAGWLPDYLYRDGHFESGVAFFSDSSGTITEVTSRPGKLSQARRLSNRAVIPGLVNAHSHAFQRAIRGRTEHRKAGEKDSFWTWRETMYQAADRLSPEDVFDVSCMAFLEMLSGGITTVGEFHYLQHAPGGERYGESNLLALEVARAAQLVGLRIVLLQTGYARAGWKGGIRPAQARFLTHGSDEFLKDFEALESAFARTYSPACVSPGIAPHSIRAVPLPFLIEVIRHARKRKLVVHMHLAEQPAEIEACQAEYGLRPVELMARHGLLDAEFTAVHAIHTTAEEIASLAEARANICVCPTTERNLGDGIAPALDWANSHIDVCFGSDSNVQIDLLEDARELEYHLRLARLERAILDAKTLFGYATEGGARSLGTAVGNLAAGRPADFVTIDLDDLSIAGAGRDSLLAQLVFAARPSCIRDVYVAGKQVIADGRHALEESIVSRFKALQRRLWR